MSNAHENRLPVVVGIRFSKIGKKYYFDATDINDLKVGDYLVVETSRGWQLGELAEIVKDRGILNNANYKKVDRLATPVDLIKHEELGKKAEKAIEYCKQEIKKQNIQNVKIVTAEFSFDENNLSFLFSCAEDNAPNLNRLKKPLGKIYHNTRIDFHKIGPRDIAKFYGGMGSCGFPERCCAKFLSKFESISIRMAKTQGISLTPSDITGMCDRLRCCLSYEHCQYVEALKNMPKRNKMVKTPNGQGKIKDIAPLRQCVYVKLEEIGLKEFHISEVEEIKQPDGAKSPQQPRRDDRRQGQGRRRRNSGGNRNANNPGNNNKNNNNPNRSNNKPDRSNSNPGRNKNDSGRSGINTNRNTNNNSNKNSNNQHNNNQHNNNQHNNNQHKNTKQ